MKVKDVENKQWTTCWSHAQRGCGLVNQEFQSQQRIMISGIKAEAIRFRFSNFYDDQTVRLRNGYLLLSDRRIAFGFDGKSEATLCPGDSVVCDAIDLSIAKQDQFVLCYEIDATHPCTSGIDLSRDEHFSTKGVIAYLFHAIDVISSDYKGCICAFGDSIVELDQWTKVLSKLVAEDDYVLVNQGIGGNRLLRELEEVCMDPLHAYVLEGTTASQAIEKPVMFSNIPLTKQCFGKAGLHRFQHDVIDTHANLKAVICAIGVNDLYQPATFCAKESELPTIEELQLGYQQLWNLVPRDKVDLFVAGITSFQLSDGASVQKEQMRLTLNAWMSEMQECYVGFDDLLCDTSGVLLDEMHDGDHLHPNQKGGAVMAKRIYEMVRKRLV